LKPFHYFEARDAGGAVALLSPEPEGKFLAGGTTLLDLMKLGVEQPRALVDVSRLDLTEIRDLDGMLSIGALATNADVAAHPLVREMVPMLSKAILAGASPQLRNMATTAGNLLQRTRCDYFRSAEQPCNKRNPGSGCAAIEGIHRAHAIFGASEHCIATYPGDMATALIALDTMVHLEGPEGKRSLPLAGFHLEPGSTPNIEIVLKRDELILGISVPFARKSTYVKVRDRASYEFALASAAVGLELRGDIIVDARVGLGGIATRPWRSEAAERVLRGAAATMSTFEEAANAALVGAKPLRDNAYKVELARAALIEALRELTDSLRELTKGTSR
jgi:xanthine dehydrogenase YagS FAD-binding subunit